jgi:hypothetical protein
MAKAAPPAFEPENSAEQWMIFKDASTTTALGQIRSFRWTDSLSSNDVVRVSDSKTYRTYTARSVTITMEMFSDNDLSEVVSIQSTGLGVNDATYGIIAQMYDSEATSATLKKTFTFTPCRTVNVEAGPVAGENDSWTFTINADAVTAS